jgi:hypothetical protein
MPDDVIIRPITESFLEEAVKMLARGFPYRPIQFWKDGVSRLRQFRSPHQAWPYGYFLQVDGADVGIILTIASERTLPEGGLQTVVNLSSWYVEPAYRGLAPFMLRRVLKNSDPVTIFTDLTPTPAVIRINEALGFRCWNEGCMILGLPWFGFALRSKGTVLPLHKLPSGALNDSVRQMMEDHAGMGAVVGILLDQSATLPLIFYRTRWKGLPAVCLAYADNRAQVLSSLSAVARFLISEGHVLLRIDGNQVDCPRCAPFFRARGRRFLRGRLDQKRIDYAYSEHVLLHVQ